MIGWLTREPAGLAREKSTAVARFEGIGRRNQVKNERLRNPIPGEGSKSQGARGS